jgi:chromosome segregation ATPase
MSCLPTDAFKHFEQREQELRALNEELDQKRARAVAEASGAVQNAELIVQRGELQCADTSAVSSSTELINDAVQRTPSRPSSGLRPRPSSASRGSEAGATDALHETIRTQHLRIVALQDELSKTIKELAAKNNEVQQLQQDAKQAATEKDRLQKMNSSSEQAQERDKKKLTESDRKMEELQRERSELAKERDQLDVRRRKLEAEVVSKDARINRLTEECERYKTAARDIGTQDRDRAVSDKRETDRLTSEVKKLERQRAELVNAFKKQMKLIDVLKRQRAHVEAARVLSFTEDEFIRILELGDKLGD